MTDQDCIAIAAALRESFESNGALDCSARALREVGLSGNADVTTAGVEVLLASLVALAEGSLDDTPKNAEEALNVEVEQTIGAQVQLSLHWLRNCRPLVRSQEYVMRLLRHLVAAS